MRTNYAMMLRYAISRAIFVETPSHPWAMVAFPPFPFRNIPLPREVLTCACVIATVILSVCVSCVWSCHSMRTRTHAHTIDTHKTPPKHTLTHDTRANKQTSTHTYTHAHTQRHTRKETNKHTHTHTCTHTHMCCTHKRTHTHLSHTYTPTDTRTDTRTHTDTHDPIITAQQRERADARQHTHCDDGGAARGGGWYRPPGDAG